MYLIKVFEKLFKSVEPIDKLMLPIKSQKIFTFVRDQHYYSNEVSEFSDQNQSSLLLPIWSIFLESPSDNLSDNSYVSFPKMVQLIPAFPSGKQLSSEYRQSAQTYNGTGDVGYTVYFQAAPIISSVQKLSLIHI